MFETLMKYGGYRVDRINQRAANQPGAFGFYVRGDLPEEAVYSTMAKHHLYAGLEVIFRELNPGLLVAVYMDVGPISNLNRAGYVELKHDLILGLFRKVFVYDANDLIGSPAASEDFESLSREVNGIELLKPLGQVEVFGHTFGSVLLRGCEVERIQS
jgi:hypothetical protein